MCEHLIVYLLSFIGIWIGSGFVVKAVEHLSRTLKISSFAISFSLLGLFTSLSEFSVGINAIVENDPEIYVGNLIGASIVLFMLVIPLLAIFGRSIKISPEFQGFSLPASLVVVSLPVILVMDGKVGKIDSIIALSLFAILLISIEAKKGVVEKIKDMDGNSSVKIGKEILKILFGVAVIFIASRFVVEQTLYFSNILNIPPFIISLLLISVGTNIPEFALVIRSIYSRNHQVAFGDYVGSAAFNTFFLGLLTLIYGKQVNLANSYLTSLLFLIVGLAMFYYFARTKNTISRLEGLVLLALYVAFIFTEIMVYGYRF